MQTAPTNWTALFSAKHKTEYRFLVNGVEYLADDIKGTPTITKKLSDTFTIGQFSCASLTLEIYPKSNIPKAAPVVAYCRLTSTNGSTVTPWVEQGHFWIQSRSSRDGIMSLVCRDASMKAGDSYTDKTSFVDWPQPMTAVVSEIASLMGVEIDSRTVIKTGTDFVVDYPNEDLLMSEILGMIAAAHGGNWIMTEKGKLRLVPMLVTDQPSVFTLGKAYQRFTPLAIPSVITRVTLSDDAGNQFTIGDDSGEEITAECDYATPGVLASIVQDDSIAVENGVLKLNAGSISRGLLNIAAANASIVNGSLTTLSRVSYQPYALDGAFVNPLLELGDFFTLNYKGQTYNALYASANVRLNVSYAADFSLQNKDTTNDEYPYKTARDLKASRYVSTTKTYHGNRINRAEGFVSEYMADGSPIARLIANSNVFSMQQKVNGAWEDRIYFDPVAQRYKIVGDVTVEGSITAEVLATPGGVNITGANITTGTISADRLDFTPINDTIATIQRDLDGLTTKVEDVSSEAIASVVVQYALSDSSSSAPASGWSPIAPAWEAGKYMWQRTVTTFADSTPEEPHVVTSAPTCIQGAAGTSAFNTAKVYLYKRSTTPPTVDWTNALTYNFTTGELSSTPSGWSSTYPTGNAPLYVTAATAHSQDATDTILPNEWTPPVLLVENGSNGSPGLNVATVFLYQRGTSAPEKPTGTITYTFATGAISGSLNGWSKTIPATNGNPCYVIQVTASNTTAQDTIAASEWSDPVVLVEDGADGIGITSVTVSYGMSASASVYPESWQSSIPVVPDGSYLWTRTITDYTDPNKPDTVTYTYAKQGEKGDTGTPGTPGTHVTVLSIQYQEGNSATTAPTGTWSSSVVSVSPGNYLWTKTTFSDGSTAYGVARQGVNGDTGPAGYNTAIVYLYKRSATPISAIDWSTNLTYSFTDKALTSVPSGWSESVPSGTSPLYVTTATAYSNTSTDTIAASEWSAPVVLAQNGSNGTNGLNVATVFLYQRYAPTGQSATPAKPSSALTYTFSSGSLSGTLGDWTQTVPASNGNPCFVIQATASSRDASVSIAASAWSAPVVLVEDGTNGDNGLGIVSIVTEYLLVEGQTTPTGDEPGWTTTPPAWSSGKYIWTRSKITWDNDPTDPDHITYTTPECNNTVTDFGQKYSEVKQNADKIAWLVASGTTAANFTMTSRAISQVAETLSLTATASEGTEVGTLSSETYPSGVYRFSKTSDGYYTSGNGGVNSSVAYGKLTFSFTEDTAVVLKCINRGETIYDFGIVSELDTTLSKDTSEDTTGVLKSFKGLVSEDPVDLTLIIPSGSHFVTFKYKKDSSAHSEGDYFKIKATTQPKPESTLTLKSGQTSLSSAKIVFSGLVTFTDLSSAGSTAINGANIKTGKIAADRIEVSDLRIDKIYYENYVVLTGNTYSDVIHVELGVKTSGVYNINDYYGKYHNFIESAYPSADCGSISFRLNPSDGLDGRPIAQFYHTDIFSPGSRIYLTSNSYLYTQNEHLIWARWTGSAWVNIQLDIN